MGLVRPLGKPPLLFPKEANFRIGIRWVTPHKGFSVPDRNRIIDPTSSQRSTVYKSSESVGVTAGPCLYSLYSGCDYSIVA